MPGPKPRWWTALLMLLANISPGILLFVVSAALLGALVQSLLTSPQLNASMVPLVLLLAVLWWLYAQMPWFVRRGIRRLVKRNRKQSPHR